MPNDNLNTVTDRPCPTCHGKARSTKVSVSSDSSSNPFALHKLVAAGSLALTMSKGEESVICRQPLAEDRWHSIADPNELRTLLPLNGQVFLFELAFLVKHKFVCATYSARRNTLFVRLYIIPFDLPNVQGQLRLRDQVTILKPAMGILQRVLSEVSIDKGSWEGGRNLVYHCERFLPVSQDGRSLSQLYNELSLNKDDFNASLPSIKGLRSNLYQYQRASVAAMMHKETNKKPITDPLYVELKGVKGDAIYCRPGDMEILYERPLAAQCQGGLLCEELGTGKTVMILSLILATLNDLPELPESIHEPLEVYTPLSYFHFPWAGRGSVQLLHTPPNRLRRTVPSLVELCLHKTRAHGCELTSDHEEELDRRQLLLPMMNNVPFYLIRDGPSDLTDVYSKRRQPKLRYRTMFLSTATLIVVPENLITQWSNEIMKHCRIPLRVLMVSSKTKLPKPHELASNFDIVLMAYSRISLEASLKSTADLYTGYPCTCRSFHNSRVPKCKCETPKGASTLSQIHWKRIVRDEGHNSATIMTNINNFLNGLVAERRWIVTGTPTTNLLGLNFGKSAEDTQELDGGGTSGLVYPEDDSNESPISSPHSSCTSAPSPTPEMNPNTTYAWGARDREDLRKLGDMMARFLRIPRFASDGDAFRKFVIAPLMNGPAPGAVKVLEQVMQSSMIRHRIEEVEQDIVLPPLKESTVLLDLHPYSLMHFNLLQAVVAVNAVDSERTDIDYLFHHRNQKALLETIENIALSLFWRTDADDFDLDLSGALKRARGARVHAIERKQPDSDVKLVEEAIKHIEIAIEDKTFRNLQHHLEVPYQVQNLSRNLRLAWASVVSEFNPTAEPAAFIYPSRVYKLRAAITRQPKMSELSLLQLAEAVYEEEQARSRWLQMRESMSKGAHKGRKKPGERTGLGGGESGRKTKTAENELRRTVDSPEKLEEVRREFLKTQAKLKALAGIENNTDERIDDEEERTTVMTSKPTGARLRFMRESPVAPVRIGNSTSTKLNYILSEVLRYAAKEKFLIFSRQPFVLVHIAEGLEVFGVRFLHLSSDISIEQRRQSLTTFETSDTYRVFLMELKYGARGLVIFCEPVWQADVESQAIKRVHRIGQTRPVTVKTLAIRGTFEEAMIGRRNALKGHSGKLPGMVDEGGIRSFLQNPRFLEPSPASDVTLGALLLFPPGLEDRQRHSGNARSSAGGTSMEVDVLDSGSLYLNEPSAVAVAEEDLVNQGINNGEKRRLVVKLKGGPPPKKRIVKFVQ